MFRLGRITLTLITVLTAVGCGSGTGSDLKSLDMGGEDGNKISSLIEEMNEAKGDAKKVNKLFAKGMAPSASDLKKLSLHSYYIAAGTKPSVTGGDGTTKVSIHNDKETKEIAQKDWTFVKEGDAWKIKSAPIQ